MYLDFSLPFLAIGLAELGDKTQLAVLLLATRTKEHARLFLGVFAGFLLVDGAAVVFGAATATMVPTAVIKIISGLLFIFFGLLTLRETAKGGIESERGLNGSFRTGFLVIAASEMGDKTQVVAALFAAEYDPALVLAGTMAALSFLSLGAIYLSSALSRHVNKSMLAKVAAVTFILIGAGTLLAP
jgi:hypothetical protein